MSSFDRLLTRRLRQPAGTDTSCPDAETLAAYLERRLTRAERAGVERHASVCARCAQHLAALVQLDDQLQEAPTKRGSAWTAWWSGWRWLVPAAAAVVAAVVWTALPRERVSEPTPPSSTRTAEAPSPELKLAPPAAAPADRAQGRETNEPGAPQLQAPAQRDAPSMETVPRTNASARADKAKKEAPSAPAPIATPTGPAPAQAPAAAPVPSRPEPAVPPAVAPAPAVAEAGHAEERTVAGNIAKEAAPRVGALSKALPRNAQAAAPAETVDALAQRQEREAGAAKPAVEATLVVRSPDPLVTWRVTPPIVERTTDGGRTWHTEPSPPLAGELLASAPSRDACWIAGAGGFVQRRGPDGRWSRATPAPGPITAIEASSAHAAVVTLSDGRTFATDDDGLTWTERRIR